MDLELATPIPTPIPKSPDENEIDTPPHTHTHLFKPLSFTNGVFKSHHHRPPPPAAVVVYKECMKNHAATLGGHAVDGCGEYMPSPTAALTDPTSLICAACGCHRNFHRREPDFPTAITPPFLDFRHPTLPRRSSPSHSPPQQQPAPFLYAVPHTLLALSSAVAAEEHHQEPVTPTTENPVGRKRSRTKFSQEQKDKMLSFSEKMGWKMHKSDDVAVEEFCHEIGVSKGVLKVWMHNNKNTFGKKEIINKNEESRETDDGGGVPFHGSNNGSSSSPSP